MDQVPFVLATSHPPTIHEIFDIRPMRMITRTVWILSLVSLFTDLASEMLYPVMPVFLQSIGFSVFLIGVLEGVAEATAGLSKGYFGKLSDHSGKRLPFVRLGYALSAISKPMMAVLFNPLWIFSARTIDRIGKGLRTAPRDAILAAESHAKDRGRIFGFHRSMDTLGAVAGPLLSLLYLYYNPGDYRNLFLIAFLPGLAAIFLTFVLKEKSSVQVKKERPGLLDFVRYWKTGSSEYRQLLTGLLLFALFNSSDLFLLLKMKEAGVSDTHIIGAYIFYNLVYAIAAYPLGILADKIGLKKIFIAGLILFATAYFGMGINKDLYVFYALFLIYGIYAAATEGVSKAWISRVCKPEETATAVGTYTAFQSICALLASAIAGFIWYKSGSLLTLVLTGSAALAVALYFILMKERKPAT